MLEMSMEEHMELYLGQGMDKKSAMKTGGKGQRGRKKRRLSGTVTDTLTLNNVPFVNLYRK